MSKKTFDQLRNETRAFLKCIAGGERCYTELRTHLQSVAQRRLIAPVGKVNLATKVGQAAIVEIAENFVSSKTIIGSTIRERGWTDGMIAKFLGAPDATAKNPHYKSAAPMKLYSLSRVEYIESTPEWQAASAKVISQRENRVAGAVKAVETKTAKLIEWVDNLSVSVPLIEIGVLISRACSHYEAHHSGSNRGYYNHDRAKYASPLDSPDFLERIIGNYIRHALTNYEYRLEQLAGKVGTGDAYEILKAKVMNKVDEVYPDLFGQICDWQVGEKQRLSDAEEQRRIAKQEREKIATANRAIAKLEYSADPVASIAQWKDKIQRFCISEKPIKNPRAKRSRKHFVEQVNRWVAPSGRSLVAIDWQSINLRQDAIRAIDDCFSDILQSAQIQELIAQ